MRDKGSGSVYRRKSDGRWAGTIEAGWTARGTRRRIVVTAKTKRDALVKLQAKRRELAAHGLPEENVRTALTVKAYAEEWLNVIEHEVSPASFANARSSIHKWVIPTIGHRRLSQLGARDIRAVSRAILDAGRKPSTAERATTVLGTMLNRAISDGITVPQSAIAAKTVTRGANDRDEIPLGDIRAILNVSAGDRMRSRILAAFLAGLRPAEARGLTWDRVDFTHSTLDVSWQLKALPYKVARDRDSGFRTPDGYEALRVEGAWHLVRPKTKAGRRIIPMIPALAQALSEWKAQCGEPDESHALVWRKPDGAPLSDKEDVAYWRSVCERARVAKRLDDGTTRPYDLYEARHSCASLLRRLGVADEVITSIMGHASILSTRAYIHTDASDALAALEKVAATLELDA